MRGLIVRPAIDQGELLTAKRSHTGQVPLASHQVPPIVRRESMAEEASARSRVSVVVIRDVSHVVVDQWSNPKCSADHGSKSFMQHRLDSSGRIRCRDRRQTTIGTLHDSHSATQHRSSS